MIDSIYSLSPEILVSAPGTSYAPSCTTGTVRWNANYNTMEVASTGNDWYKISGGAATISLAPYVQEILKWAQLKMFEDMQLKDLCIKHPELQSAKDQFENVALLAKKNEEERRKFDEQLRIKQRTSDTLAAALVKEVTKSEDLQEKLDSWTVLTA